MRSGLSCWKLDVSSPCKYDSVTCSKTLWMYPCVVNGFAIFEGFYYYIPRNWTSRLSLNLRRTLLRPSWVYQLMIFVANHNPILFLIPLVTSRPSCFFISFSPWQDEAPPVRSRPKDLACPVVANYSLTIDLVVLNLSLKSFLHRRLSSNIMYIIMYHWHPCSSVQVFQHCIIVNAFM